MLHCLWSACQLNLLIFPQSESKFIHRWCFQEFSLMQDKWVLSFGLLQNAFCKFIPVKDHLPSTLLCLLLSYRHQQIHILNNSHFRLVKTRVRWAGCWEHSTCRPSISQRGGRLGLHHTQDRVSQSDNFRPSVIWAVLSAPVRFSLLLSPPPLILTS